ncbi:peroxide stress protein YaaA [Calycomorphotria hydatis]|uniref:UPF0246 protein V22_33530 n=1 Tax=Calycomorphotria hydatis TaxID=2528027 RepID=A0A517TCI6_9PLAN|nr:peroxide stress protein YaaA [Calycomorphotria hydatis]QDT66089.1 hypothetical protein V22_33530 [Calycomorphotria hydatis]
MLIVISPAKTMQPPGKAPALTVTQPRFLDQSETLITRLQKLSAKQIGKQMGISDDLAQLNHERFQEWSTPFTEKNATPAILYFRGDVYEGLDADSFKKKDFTAAQKQLRILSGLYGLLRPLDLIQAYRLEMGTKFLRGKPANLYQFWGEQLTETLNNDLAEAKTELLLNLASNEYFKALKPKSIDAEIITPAFKEEQGGQYKLISFFAKKARGLMTRFVIQNKIKTPDDLQDFHLDRYTYNKKLSTDTKPVFTRPYQTIG